MKIRNIFILIMAMVMIMTMTACNVDNAPKETVASVTHHSDFPNVDITGMTDLQKAVVLTAESFVLRKERGQYDDTRLTASKNLAYYRWSVDQRQPEDYTSQYTGYSNCAAFVYDLYKAALDINIQYYTTANLTAGSPKVLARTPIAAGFASLSEEQLEVMKQEFLDNLQPGDLIVYRYEGNQNGHAMCYVGNNMMIHCTGSSYNYADQVEKFEDNGCFRYESIDSFWDKENRRYLFNKNSYVIIRPLDGFTGEIPQRTLDKMDVMRGVMAEKTSSVLWTQTVNPGQEVTFTFTLQNLTGWDKTLTVTDTVPENTTYLSGADKQEGNTLSWKVELPAGETAAVSYTVHVEDTAKLLESNGFVESVPVNCPAITVGKTLTSQEQEALAAAAAEVNTSNSGLISAAAIYQQALGVEILKDVAAEDILEGIFRYYAEDIESGQSTYDDAWPAQWRSLDADGEFYKLIAPGLYGGRNVLEGADTNPVTTLAFMGISRVRIVAQEQLITGDIIITNDETEGFQASSWMYVDGRLLNLQTGEMIPAEPMLSQLICHMHFVVIRPSLGM